MASAALKYIPITSAWASPTLEAMGAAIEAELHSIGHHTSDRADAKRADLRNAFDLIAEADLALANAGWDQ